MTYPIRQITQTFSGAWHGGATGGRVSGLPRAGA